LEEFFEQRILGPLGMRDTGFDVPAADRLAAIGTTSKQGFIEAPNETAGEGPRGGGALYSTARDYLILLRVLLNGGRLGDVQLLTPESVQEMTRNQIGELPAERQVSAAPQRTDDFLFMDGSQKFGFGLLVETRDKPDARAAGSYGWGGIYNTYFWVDPAAQIGAVAFMQMTPFSTPACIELYDRFEIAVYDRLAQRHRR
jgi:CubicO group peptidase (beta-lactamase class C family)